LGGASELFVVEGKPDLSACFGVFALMGPAGTNSDALRSISLFGCQRTSAANYFRFDVHPDHKRIVVEAFRFRTDISMIENIDRRRICLVRSDRPSRFWITSREKRQGVQKAERESRGGSGFRAITTGDAGVRHRGLGDAGDQGDLSLASILAILEISLLSLISGAADHGNSCHPILRKKIKIS